MARMLAIDRLSCPTMVERVLHLLVTGIDQAVRLAPVRRLGICFAARGGPLAQAFGLHQFISETQQPKNLQGGQGRWKLGRSKLGVVEPFLHGQGLDRSVSFQQSGNAFNRQLRLLSSYESHNPTFGEYPSIAPVGDLSSAISPRAPGSRFGAAPACRFCANRNSPRRADNPPGARRAHQPTTPCRAASRGREAKAVES